MLSELEAGLGYTFRDKSILENALTHSSYANENRERGLRDNERLEFLGDSILGFVVADYLYRNFPDRPEGELTRIRADLVCEKNLARAAATIRLGSFLLLGHGEEHGGGRKRDSIVSDAMESVIAASYMDGGFSAAKEIIDRLILCDVPAGKPHNFDYKTALQELVQRKKDQVLRYELVGESGPDHDKKFEVEVLLNGSPCGKGSGSSKKRAEQAAAAAVSTRCSPESCKIETAGMSIPAVLLCSNNLDLAHFHRAQRRFVALRRHPCAAVCPHRQRDLRQGPLCHHRVRNDADVGAEADEFNAFQRRQPLEKFDQGRGAEAGLVKDRRVQNRQCRVDLPAICSLHAVRDWQISSLLRGQILRVVRIAREDDQFAVLPRFFQPCRDPRYDRNGFFCPQRAVNKILLHINNGKNLHHTSLLFVFHAGSGGFCVVLVGAGLCSARRMHRIIENPRRMRMHLRA